MLPSLLRGVVVAGAAGLVAALPSALGLTSPWPVLLVAAVAFARPLRPGPIAAVLLGSGSWWIAMALRAAVLPDATSSLVLAAVVAIAICTAVAAATREHVPLWASLAGIALFAALYEPAFADEPTKFLAQSTVALGSVVVAVGIGALAALLADTVAAVSITPRDRVGTARQGEVA